MPKDHGLRSVIADNFLDRQLMAEAPNQRWIADFTYIWTAEGWLYVAVVVDALMMSIWRRGKPDALLHHSDQGSHYTSEKFQGLIADNGVTCSIIRSGNVWDNAAMESFFSSLKTEQVGRKTYRTRNHAKADVFDYIECFYNSTPPLDAGLSQPHGLRSASAGSLTSCPRNRQQLNEAKQVDTTNGATGNVDASKPSLPA